ncbi:MAG: carbohydrate ABC transporter permease [Actinomycetota bacterium]
MTAATDRAGKPAALPRPRRSAYSAIGRPSNALTVVMLAFVVYFLIPLVWLLMSSTKSNSGLYSSFGFGFSNEGFRLFSNIRETFTKNDHVFVQWMLNTLLYAGVSSVGAALLATLGGYGFAKYTFRGKEKIFGFILGSIMVPATALAIPTYLLFAKVGLVNTRWAIILPSLLSPFGIYLMRVYASEAIPDSLLEAARIDGASEFRIFRQVAFRQLAPGFVTVLLFTLVATWNNYFLPLIMLNDPKLFPVTVGLAQWNSQASVGGGTEVALNIVLTGALGAILPLGIAFLLLQRYWQSGLGTGGVKE